MNGDNQFEQGCMDMKRCEVCGCKGQKRITVAEYAIRLCESCYRTIREELDRQNIPFVTGTKSGPKGSLLGKIQYDEFLEAGLAAEPDALLCLWQYPHEDWELAVSSGITDLPSYRELENRIASLEAMCKRQGRPVVVVEMGVQDLFDLLDSEGIENTSENRTKMIIRLGSEAFRRAMDEPCNSDE